MILITALYLTVGVLMGVFLSIECDHIWNKDPEYAETVTALMVLCVVAWPLVTIAVLYTVWRSFRDQSKK